MFERDLIMDHDLILTKLPLTKGLMLDGQHSEHRIVDLDFSFEEVARRYVCKLYE